MLLMLAELKEHHSVSRLSNLIVKILLSRYFLQSTRHAEIKFNPKLYIFVCIDHQDPFVCLFAFDQDTSGKTYFFGFFHYFFRVISLGSEASTTVSH